MPQRYLMLVTFGPVQGFISQARKTADLYAGSQILCELAKHLLEQIPRVNICYPDPTYDESLTNRIVFEFTGEASEVKTEGEKLVDSLKEKWRNMAKGLLPEYKTNEAVKNQIDNHLETAWVAVPIGNDYATAYTSLDKYLAASKNQKVWNTTINEPYGRKCSLDGTRNALYYRPKEAGKGIAQRVTKGAIVVNDDSLQINEALSAVSYVKRKFGKAESFPSTAKIALLDIFDNHDIVVKDALFKRNDQLYFEENVNAKYFEKSGYDVQHLKDIRDKLKAWKEQVADKQLKASPYFALLLFDGDAMGQWFSGEFLVNRSEKFLQDFHKKLTTSLGNFAKEATAYLNTKGRGRTIFAGGDDFMGFINLNHLFEVLQHLRALFDELVNEQLPKENINGNLKLTFSAGVAIAHYKQPLGMVIDEAHRMEQKAKNWKFKDKDKNAYAIGAMVRAGSTDELVMPWFDETNASTISYLKTLTEDLTNSKTSNTFITMLEQETRHYGGDIAPDILEDLVLYYFNRANSFLPKEAATSIVHLKSLISLQGKQKPEIQHKVENKEENEEEQQGKQLSKIQAVFNVCEFLSRHINPINPDGKQ